MKINHKEIFASINKHKEKNYWNSKLSNFEIKKIAHSNVKSFREERSEHYNKYKFEIKEGFSEKILNICNYNNNNLFVFLYSEITILLSKILNKTDLIIACPILKQGNSNIINRILPIRSKFNENIPFKDLLNNIKQNIVDSINNQDYSIYSIVRDLELPENEFIFPLFDVAVLLDNIHDKEYLSDLNLNLIFHFKRVDDEIHGAIEYNFDSFDEKLIESLVSCLNYVLEQTISSLDIRLLDIEVNSKNDKEFLLFGFNNTKTNYPNNKLIHQLFEEQAINRPKAIALEHNGKCLNYRDLNNKSNELAKILIEKGVGPNNILGLMLDNSFELLISILGILKAGAAYLPIDVKYPTERKRYIIEDSKLDIIITNNFYLNENIDIVHNISFDNLICIDNLKLEGINNELPKIEYATSNICYVIYTSGSTGKPKGTLISQNSLVNYINWAAREYNVSGFMNFPLYSSISFDLTVTSIFLPLVMGGKIVIYDSEDISNTFSSIFENKDIGVVKLTPSHLEILKNLEVNESSVRKLIIGGEQLTSSLCNDMYNLLGKDIEIYNEYGPTETVVGCMIYKYDQRDIKRENVSIGRPADNTEIYLFDTFLKPVSKLSEGEIYIGGDCVSIGYLNQVELTEEKFIKNPYRNGNKMYKTGDLAKWLPNENIEYIKRIDEQVKIRGFRVELGEIEKYLLTHEEIKSSIVILREDKEYDNYLCAYIILNNSDQDLKELKLKGYLSKYLPDYMIPLSFVKIQEFPLNHHGKIDKKQLPKPNLIGEMGYDAPSNELEQALVDIWADILKIPANKIGVNTNFFELGGHSLKATVLSSRIYSKTNIRVPLSEIFKYPTIREISGYINLIKLRKSDKREVNDSREILKL